MESPNWTLTQQEPPEEEQEEDEDSLQEVGSVAPKLVPLHEIQELTLEMRDLHALTASPGTDEPGLLRGARFES